MLKIQLDYLLARLGGVREEDGQTTVEYALVIGAIILIAGVAIALLGGKLNDFFGGIDLGGPPEAP
jgi:Flp pilus assembly pilin Flp